MSSGKPQTRGLAALLRIEKERRAREETDASETITPESEGGQDSSTPRAGSHRVQATESNTEASSKILEESSNPSQAHLKLPGGEAFTQTPLEQQSDAVSVTPASAESGEQQQRTSERNISPVASLPRPRPAPARPPRTLRRKVVSQSEAILVADPVWQKFVADWKPFLREGVKFKLCEFFYRNTTALGRSEFKTSTAQLSRVSGAHRRHIFLVLRQLEDLKFIQKENLGMNKRDEGLLIRFFPNREA